MLHPRSRRYRFDREDAACQRHVCTTRVWISFRTERRTFRADNRPANHTDLHDRRGKSGVPMRTGFSNFLYPEIVDAALLARDRESRSVVVYARRWVAKATLINRARELYLTDLWDWMGNNVSWWNTGRIRSDKFTWWKIYSDSGSRGERSVKLICLWVYYIAFELSVRVETWLTWYINGYWNFSNSSISFAR